MQLIRFISLVLAGLLLLPFAVQAAVLDDVQVDFEPVDGYVVMLMEGEVLIDVDARQRVTNGDLFSVVAEGKPIIHPVTNEMIGRLDDVKGLLKVTRVKSGYSYTVPVSEVATIKPGDRVRRYMNIPAVFWDYTGNGEVLYADLKATIPHLEWQDYAAAQVDRPEDPARLPVDFNGLAFILRDGSLQVRGPKGQVIHAYSIPKSVAAVPSAPLRQAPQAPVAVAPVPESPGVVQWQKQAAAPQGQVRYEASYPAYQNLGELPIMGLSTDFIQYDGKLLLAVTNGRSISVLSVDDGMRLVAKGDSNIPASLLTLSWWLPETGGPLYLAVTSASEDNTAYNPYQSKTIRGLVFRLEGQSLVQTKEYLPMILGSLDMDQDGLPETLLGQRFDRETFFGNKLVNVTIHSGSLITAPAEHDFKRTFPITGASVADLNGNGRLETIYVRQGILHIFEGDEELFQSSKEMGGSLASLTYNVNPDAADPLHRTESFEIPPLVVDLDNDGQQEIVAVASDTSFINIPGVGPGVKHARLVVFKHQNDMFIKGEIGEEVDSPIQGLAMDANRLLFVPTRTGAFLTGEGRSNLLSLPLVQ